MEGLRDHSRRPHNRPNATHVDVVGKIVYLRQNYHFGPGKIAMYLRRYHDVQVSQSGIWRILKRLDLNRLPASQRYKRLDKRYLRYEKHVKLVEPLKTAAKPAVGRRTKYYQFTAIDDCTRLRVLRIYPRCDQRTAIQFLDCVLERLPLSVQLVQTDNGAEFQSAFHYHVLDRGIGHCYIKPGTTPAGPGRPRAGLPQPRGHRRRAPIQIRPLRAMEEPREPDRSATGQAGAGSPKPTPGCTAPTCSKKACATYSRSSTKPASRRWTDGCPGPAAAASPPSSTSPNR